MPATNAMIFLTIWQFLNLSLAYILLKYYSIVEIEFELKSRNEIYLFAGVFYSILTNLVLVCNEDGFIHAFAMRSG